MNWGKLLEKGPGDPERGTAIVRWPWKPAAAAQPAGCGPVAMPQSAMLNARGVGGLRPPNQGPVRLDPQSILSNRRRKSIQQARVLLTTKQGSHFDTISALQSSPLRGSDSDCGPVLAGRMVERPVSNPRFHFSPEVDRSRR